MLKKIMLSLLVILSLNAQGQEPFYQSYSWDTNPDYSNFKTDQNVDLLSFKEKIVSEFFFIEDGLIEYYSEHKILWLNSDDKIEEYNKIYLPYKSNSKLMVSKARVITKNGKIITLDDSKIFTAKNEETNKTYKYFALEGVEKGSFIEYYYVIKQYPRYKGVRINLQSPYNKYNVNFDLFAPKNLIFEFKSYNALKNIEKDTLISNKRHWSLNLDQITKIEDEEQSSYKADKQFLVYKLDKNMANSSSEISSYNTVAKNIYNYLYLTLSKKAEIAIETIIRESGINNESNHLSKIRALENYLKSNYYISEINNDNLNTIETIVKNKTGNEVGFNRIFIAVLKKLSIPIEVVLTSNRFETKFDKTFEANNFLVKYLLYFPSIKKFTSLNDISSRVGYAPFELTDNYGLFIKEIVLGDFKSGIGKIKFIKAATAEDTKDVMQIDVTFDPNDLSNNLIKLKRSYGGYYAGYFQPYLDLMSEEQKNELYDELIKSMSKNITIKDKEIFNDRPELMGVKPLKITASIETEAFSIKAGNKLLFKLGELIGKQIEMYQEKDRKLAVESDFNRFYDRIINVKIPEGYSVENLDDINIHYFYDKEGTRLLEFHSFFKLNNNILSVTANEFYKINRIEANNYESYRSVINGAADFNKIVLVMKKIK